MTQVFFSGSFPLNLFKEKKRVAAFCDAMAGDVKASQLCSRSCVGDAEVLPTSGRQPQHLLGPV